MSNLIIEERDNSINPFEVPSNEDVFNVRDREKVRRKQKREEERKVPLHERGMKHHFTIKRRKFREKLPASHRPESTFVCEQTTSLHRGSVTSTTTTASSPGSRKPPPKRRVRGAQPNYQKEKMNNFVVKKRQMFHLQLAIDTKRYEMEKLHKKAAERESKIIREEMRLEKDRIRFEDFLTENDIKSSESERRCDEETKMKILKQKEIKNLKIELATLKTTIEGLEQHLDFCKSYKEFLDRLTPKSFFRRNRRRTKKKKNRIRADQIFTRQPKNLENTFITRKYYDDNDDENDENDKDSNSSSSDEEENEKSEESEESEEPLRMYFVEPDQLLNLFTGLEKKNLDLIQENQELEEQIDKRKKFLSKIQVEQTKKIDDLRQQHEETEEKINQEDESLRSFRVKKQRTIHDEIHDELNRVLELIKQLYFMVRGLDRDEEEEQKMMMMMNNLNSSKKKIKPNQQQQHEQSSGRQHMLDEIPDSELQHLDMLTYIENILERCVSQIYVMSENQVDIIVTCEKSIEKERRAIAREERNREMLEKVKNKNKMILIRSTGEGGPLGQGNRKAGRKAWEPEKPKRKVKPIMRRSRPISSLGKKSKDRARKKKKSEKIDGFTELFGI